jgi:hypothetical protein
MENIILGLIAYTLTYIISIYFHEFGHYVTSRLIGLKIHETKVDLKESIAHVSVSGKITGERCKSLISFFMLLTSGFLFSLIPIIIFGVLLGDIPLTLMLMIFQLYGSRSDFSRIVEVYSLRKFSSVEITENGIIAHTRGR